MHFGKRELAALALAGTAVPMSALASGSEAPYPQRAVTLVVGYPPGGGADALARLLARHMAEDLEQNVLIENRPGAAGNIAAESVARATPDGYTLYLTARPNTLHKVMYGYLTYDLANDLTPVGLLATSHSVIVTGKHAPIASVRDLITLAKAYPGALTCASPGVGADGYILCELFKQETHTDVVHVPYRGAAPALIDLIGGRVDVLITSLSSALPHIKAGSVRALAVTSRQRVPVASHIPTIYESGIPGLDLDTWYGLTAPAGTPSQVIARLNESVNAVLMKSELEQALMEGAYGAPLQPNTPETFKDFIAEETERWTAFLKARDIGSEN
jgi:tripartite-type tricarboxylate transporter receptor subunit TctC